MSLVDTHCHITMMVKENEAINRPLTEKEITHALTIVQEAQRHNVTTMINVGTNYIESLNSILLAKASPSIRASIGLHPNDATSSWKDEFHLIKKLLTSHFNYIVAIGEVGIDLYRNQNTLALQNDVFQAQIELALEFQLPLIIHTRNAAEETYTMLEKYRHEPLRGIIHCFSEDYSFAQAVLSMGFMIGIGGTITYPKNELLREVVQKTSLEHIVLETDAPFLPPQIIRGKQNHPLYIETIANFIAELLDVSPEIVAERTTKNALSLFMIHPSFQN
ncbi:MAG: TatD family hydrolase [Candidatus Babeliales bacterium]